MIKKKWIVIAAVIALIAAAVVAFEFLGIRQSIKDSIEEKKMWESTSNELVEHINKDGFFTRDYGKIESCEIVEKEAAYADDGSLKLEITISGETKTHVLQIYASKEGEDNWRYRVKDVLIK